MNLPAPLLMSPLLFLLLTISTMPGCWAEKWDERYEHFIIDADSVHLPSLYGEIHGRGYLNFDDWNFVLEEPQSLDVEVEVAIAVVRDDFQTTTKRRFGQEGVLKSVGIGAEGIDGSYYYCCTQHALYHKACSRQQLYHLITTQDDHSYNNNRDNNKKDAHLTVSSIPIPTGQLESKDNVNKVAAATERVRSFQRTTHMLVLVANCGPSHTEVKVEGSIIWKSYVATNSLPFILTITLGHAYLVMWYGRLMATNSMNHIPLEKWIFGTLILALVATLLRSILYGLESTLDYEVTWFRMITDFATILKTTASCCLFLMVAMGWGVTKRPTLSSSTSGNNSMNTTIMVMAAVWILAQIKIMQEQDNGNADDTSTTYKMAIGLSSLLGIIFLLWIPLALLWTMCSLQQAEDYFKLQRFRWMLQIYLVAVLLQVTLRVLFALDLVEDHRKDIDVMSIEDGDELIYLGVVAWLAHLWRPNLDAAKYGYYVSLLDDVDQQVEAGNHHHGAPHHYHRSTSVIDPSSSGGGGGGFELELADSPAAETSTTQSC